MIHLRGKLESIDPFGMVALHWYEIYLLRVST
jgi:hypothetical protein